ncbi:MAG: thioredoxin family protein [Phycisphaeraceae bacterium]|nr:MAG: thioredoxin family protein [Phycisphaeraceae bacterium]
MNRIMKSFAGVGVALLATGAMVAATAGPEGHSHADRAPDKAKVGHAAPNFTLLDLDGKDVVLKDVLAMDDTNAVVLEWFNPECPVVKGHYNKDTMANVQEKFDGKGVVWLRINSGGEGKQGYGVDKNKAAAEDWGIEDPILMDASGKVGKMYGAKTTPHMYVIDGEGVLQYAGAIDDNMRNATKNYVELALTSVLAGETVETAETRAYGCGVKYAN